MPAFPIRLVGGAHPTHALQGPEQVHRGGAAGGQIVADFIDVAACIHTDAHAVRRRHADRRGAAHAEPLDRLPHILDRAAFEIHRLRRQPRLIEQHEMATDIAFPANRGEWFQSYRHATTEAVAGPNRSYCSRTVRLNSRSTASEIPVRDAEKPQRDRPHIRDVSRGRCLRTRRGIRSPRCSVAGRSSDARTPMHLRDISTTLPMPRTGKACIQWPGRPGTVSPSLVVPVVRPPVVNTVIKSVSTRDCITT